MAYPRLLLVWSSGTGTGRLASAACRCACPASRWAGRESPPALERGPSPSPMA